VGPRKKAHNWVGDSCVAQKSLLETPCQLKKQVDADKEEKAQKRTPTNHVRNG
jgi:hypothetical protein